MVVHGGATWNSKVNRAKVHDGARIMQSPALLEQKFHCLYSKVIA